MLTSQPAPATPHQKKPARLQLFGISPSQEPSSQMHHSCLRNFRTEQLSFLKFLKCHHFSPLAWVPSLAKLKGKFSLIFLVLLKISFWKFRYCHLELEHALGSTYFFLFFFRSCLVFNFSQLSRVATFYSFFCFKNKTFDLFNLLILSRRYEFQLSPIGDSVTQWPFLISLAAAHNELTILYIKCFYTHFLYFHSILCFSFGG